MERVVQSVPPIKRALQENVPVLQVRSSVEVFVSIHKHTIDTAVSVAMPAQMDGRASPDSAYVLPAPINVVRAVSTWRRTINTVEAVVIHVPLGIPVVRVTV